MNNPETLARPLLNRQTHTAVTIGTGVACACMGAAVIVGWHFGLPLVVQIRAEYRPMPYASAVNFLLIGVAVVAVARGRDRAARAIAATVLAVVAALLSESLGGPDLSFQTLLQLSAFHSPKGVFGRLPPQAALNFALLAGTIFQLTSEKPRWSLIALAGSAVTAIGLTGVFGYVTNLTGAYSWQGLPPMAFHGGIAFTGLGLWCAYTAWHADSADAWWPQWIAGPIFIAASTTSLVLWQALLQVGDNRLGTAVLITGLAVAACLAVSVHFANAAHRELDRAEAAALQLRAEILDRRRTEQALRESEEKLAKTFATNPSAVAVTRLSDGLFIDINESWQAMFALRREEAIGSSSLDLHLWPTPEARRRVTELLHQRGSLQAWEQTLVRKSGEEFVALISAAMLTVAGEELVLWNLVDITGRKRNEEALRESEAQLSAFFNSPGAMRGIVEVVADDDFSVETLNEAAAASFARTPASIRGKCASELDALSDELRRQCVAACRRSQETHAPVSFEYTGASGGRGRYLSIAVSYVDTTPEGRARFAFNATDITARERAEERLRSLQATTAALSAAVTPRRVGEVALNEGLRTVGGTVAAIGVVATDAQELDVWSSVGLSVNGQATWCRYPLTSRTALADAIRSEKIVAVSSATEFADRYPDGAVEFRELGLSTTAAIPLKIENRVLGAMAFSFARPRRFSADDLKFLETVTSQIAQAYERARLFQEAALRAAALREVNARLADGDRRKDEFLATLAHELRNPLAPIRFALRLVEAPEADTVTARRGFAVISRQVTQLVRLIDDLLDVSRITRNKIQLRKEHVAVSAVIRSVVEAVEPQMTAAGHRFTVTVRGDAIIEADPTRIVQVFTNLLNNAAKFTPPGGEIALDAAVERSEAVIRVRDNGIGIAYDALPRVFDMFHQVDGSVERSAGGLGIGLALAKSLVALHGGTIDAASDGPKQGATFTVRLNVVELIEEAAPRPEVATAAHGPTRPLSVLVVDDNVDAADMLAMVVGRGGHRTLVAYDGHSAIAAATEFTPDVVLLDIGLPGMSGYTVARELRQKYGDAIRLVAITGWGQSDDRRRARDAGFDCHMTKPADADVVLGYLNAVAHRCQCAGCAKCLDTPLTRAFDRAPLVGDAPGAPGEAIA